MRSPADTVNSPTVFSPSPWISAVVCSTTMSGPAMAISAPSSSLLTPRYRGAVPVANDKLRPHPHRAALADDEADEVGVGPPRRHEVDDKDGAVIRFETRFQDQCVAAITACNGGRL